MCERIKQARRAAFKLRGAGLVGLVGVGPEVATVEYTTYVIPTLLYGLEALTLERKEIDKLELYHRKNLRYIQHLPQSTATPAIHLLTGIPPIEAMIHIRTLCLFRNIVAADGNSPPATYIRDLVTRQLAMKDVKSASWVIYVCKLLRQYQLPTAYSMVDGAPRKATWKRTVKLTVLSTWDKLLHEQADTKSTLSLLNLDTCKLGALHPVWQDLSSPLEIQKATVKAQLMVQRYPLATSPTAGVKRTETCPLCKREDETTLHFLLYCTCLADDRYPYLVRIFNICREHRIPIEPEVLVRIILDSSHLQVPMKGLEELSRNMVFKLHHRRAIAMGGGSAYKLAHNK